MKIPALLRDRRRAADDEGVAIVMALIYIIVFTALMLSMLAVVVNQVKPTAQARKDVGSLNAASSGIQSGLAVLRSATDATGAGNRGRLPCTSGPVTTFMTGSATASTPGTTLSASASGLPGSFSYRVDTAYYLTDPTDQPPSWLKANAMACPLPQTPLYAYLQAYGTGANIAQAGGSSGNRGNRSQTGVYKFSVPAENIAGGRLLEYGTNLCLEVSGVADLGSTMKFQTCRPLGTPSQTWEYREDLTLFFGGDPAKDLCVQGSTTAPPTLQRCTGTGYGSTFPYAAGQQIQEWSFNDSGHFATASDTGDVTGDCLQPTDTSLGSALSVYGCSGGTTEYQAFDPDPEVGAGKAGGNTTGLVGSPTNQYVNFAEFGRCLDITGQMVNADHLIAYPCKQAPLSTRLTFNQVWKWTVVSGQVGTMSVHTPADQDKGGLRDTDYCLTAPATGSLIVMSVCAAGQLDQQWTATGEVPGSPLTSYNLISSTRNQCMSVSRAGAITYGSSNIVLEPCDGSTKQRWNAPPPLPDAGLNNVEEGSTAR